MHCCENVSSENLGKIYECRRYCEMAATLVMFERLYERKKCGTRNSANLWIESRLSLGLHRFNEISSLLSTINFISWMPEFRGTSIASGFKRTNDCFVLIIVWTFFFLAQRQMAFWNIRQIQEAALLSFDIRNVANRYAKQPAEHSSKTLSLRN